MIEPADRREALLSELSAVDNELRAVTLRLRNRRLMSELVNFVRGPTPAPPRQIRAWAKRKGLPFAKTGYAGFDNSLTAWGDR